MAGHSKFKKIMHRKGAQDKKRSLSFSRLGREITVSVRTGGPYPESNIRLRSAISAAKYKNMPKENIQRAIKKGEENNPDSNYEEVRYEGYGPSGIAVIVEVLTNNKNRTASEIRSIFTKHGGKLGETGSVNYNFKRLGVITLEKKLVNEDAIFELVMENGSVDFEISDDQYLIYCESNNLNSLNEKIINKFGNTISSQLTWRSDNKINVKKENTEQLFNLLNTLEENEDVQNISSNFELSEKILSEYAG